MPSIFISQLVRRNLILFILAVSVAACENPFNKSKPHNELTVAVKPAVGAWHSSGDETRGVDYDLLELFAEYTGYQLTTVFVDTVNEAFAMLDEGQAQLAIGSLVLPESQSEMLAAGPSYVTVKQLVVHRYDETPPDSPEKIKMRDISVDDNPAHLETLAKLRRQNDDPTLWTLENNAANEDLIALTNEGMLRYAVVDSHELSLLKPYYPNVAEAFAISEASASWIFQRSDEALKEQLDDFFAAIKKNRELENILDRYYGHAQYLSYADKLVLLKNFDTKLNTYKPIFQEVGAAYQIDWRLLAAISYQESHWNPEAKSVSGVKGLMMVTQDVITLADMSDRDDPVQSVIAGTQYLTKIKDRLSPQIPEPDKTWIALVAYNVGFGYLQRLLAPSKDIRSEKILWVDVRDALKSAKPPPEITFPHTFNPNHYLYNIRAYYDIIAWMSSCTS